MEKKQIEKWVYDNLGELQALVAEDNYELINEIASDILVVFNMPVVGDWERLLIDKIKHYEFLMENKTDGRL